MDFMELYAQKRMTAAQAAALVKSGDWVDYGWAVNTPVAVDAELAKRLPELEGGKDCLHRLKKTDTVNHRNLSVQREESARLSDLIFSESQQTCEPLCRWCRYRRDGSDVIERRTPALLAIKINSILTDC